MFTYLAVLNTGRFGDWVFVWAENEEAARKKLTPRQRRLASSVSRVRTTKEWQQEYAETGGPFKGRSR